MDNLVCQVQNIYKSFHVGTADIPVLKNISFDIKSGDFLIIYGPSGCGKSTLLHVMLGLEEPTKGSVILLGKNLYNSTIEDDRSEFRKIHVGMVYQQSNWVKSLTVIENVAFPLLLLGQEKQQATEKARKLLQTIGMDGWANYIPTELSSGQQQKIALARALATDPEVIIADEPTGNLDFESSQELMQLLTNLNKASKTIIMVTHDLEYLKYAKTAIHIFNGEVLEKYNEDSKGKLLTKVKSKRGTVNIDGAKA